MAAKDQHTIKLIEYLSDPNNDFLNRGELAVQVLGIKRETFYLHFTAAELDKIEEEALKIRRTRYSPAMSKIDKALIAKAEEGDVAAAKLAFQRYEGWSEKQKLEHTGPDGGAIVTIIRGDDAKL